jgi:hypothetical protein
MLLRRCCMWMAARTLVDGNFRKGIEKSDHQEIDWGQTYNGNGGHNV